MGRRGAVRRELRLPRQPRALALHRRDAGGQEADGGVVATVVVPAKAGTHTPVPYRQTAEYGSRPCANALGRDDTLRLRRLLLVRREAAVEGFVVRGNVEQQLGRRKARAVFFLEFAAQLDELLRPHHVDIR